MQDSLIDEDELNLMLWTLQLLRPVFLRWLYGS